METELINEGGFNYIENGEGRPIIILHGLMGGLSNFKGVYDYFPSVKHKVIIPELPVDSTPILKTNVATFSKFVFEFIEYKNLKDVVLLGNSLGGHVALLFARDYPELVSGLIITGSSGLYEKSMIGDGYPKRGNYEYIKTKTEEVFYDPKIATKEIVDDVFASVNNREKLVLIPLAFLVVFFGLYPSPVISLISSSSENLVDILNLYFNDKLSMELKN